MASFRELSGRDQITYMKREFNSLTKTIFENPELLKIYVNEKMISDEQAHIILNHINKLNSKTCVCCRRYDPAKLKVSPIEKDLEPLLDIAQMVVMEKRY